MDVSESVILPLPRRVQAIREAAHLFTEQFGVIAHIQVRGQVQLQDTSVCEIPEWITVAQLDDTFDLLGLGDGTEMEDDKRLLWVLPLQGEIRLSELEEEN
ncbi:hypothetical protein KSC_031890 [Ktedonobacter sp. SOSP1-52]|uniref:hypothetical protein n=1 Tax=Ktedonobacter sp. SOSP1-52 TaxID=2778366 RepID=UPI00191654CF|nr:hypothetical protein [Ktedonobacter sp. SOSP1-52]GHO64297.1 hypothetical protein KSC_031890 [Ktedonobacter sp. SOSP1-52]